MQPKFLDFIQLLDGYKLDHRRQYPKKTQIIYSNDTCRGSRIFGQNDAIFFGLQYTLQRYFIDLANETFFDRPVDEVCAEYQEMLDSYLGPNGIGTEHIRALHNLGYLPLEFHAVPEGTHVPLNMPCFTVVNTNDDFFWLTNYFETLLACVTWMGINSATIAYRFRRILDEATLEQGGDPAFVQWQGHDFSFRGMAGTEAAVISGAAHLLSFTGTDTVPALAFLKEFYYATNLIGGSVPATEHSVMCAGGEFNEGDTVDHLLDIYPSGILSIVSDTWDLWHMLQVILPSRKARIIARDGKVVVRPDSGDPVKIICGDPDADPNSPEFKGVVEILWEQFGGTTNEKGFKTLDSHVGVIYGDSINEQRLVDIKNGLAAKGFSIWNMVFGVGSFTYQYNTRDTLSQAMKATYAVVDNVEYMLHKNPKTDPGMKRSAHGMMQVFDRGEGKYELVQHMNWDQWKASFDEPGAMLQPVFRDGQFLRVQTLDDIRTRVLNAPQPELVAA
jgi:nicotinamide phosphoribosyltransferase